MSKLTWNLPNSRSKAEVFVPVDAPRYATFIYILFEREEEVTFLQWINYGHSFSQVDSTGDCIIMDR
jgi:hypothetical protein